MDPELHEPQGMTLRDYAHVLARRWWIIVLVAVVATGAAFFFSVRQTKVYQATAKLIYERPIDVANPLTGQSGNDPNTRQAEVSGAVTVLGSPDMQQRGDAVLQKELGAAPTVTYKVTGEIEESGTNTAYISSVVLVSGESSDPALAQAAANAYSTAFIVWRKEKEVAAIDEAIAALKSQMKEYSGAAKLSTEFVILAQRLQDLQIRKATVSGNFRLVVPAALPESPVAPKPLRSAILGLAVGLFAGIGLAFLLEQFDTRLHGQQEISRILKRPVIGRIPRFRADNGEGGMVVTLKEPDGQAAESFRVLRSNLEFLSVDSEARVIAVTSAQQGEGKSVTACNLAVSMALAGKRVVLIDGDLRRPRVHKYLGLTNEQGVTTVVTGQSSPFDTLQRVDLLLPGAQQDGTAIDDVSGNGSAPRLYALTRGPKAPNPGEIAASQRFGTMVREYLDHAEVVLIDTPAFLVVGDAAAMARAVDGIVFVVDTDVVKRPTLEAAAERLAQLPAPVLGVVVMRHKVGKGYYSSYDYGHYYTEDSSGDGQKSNGRRRPSRQGARS